MRNIVKAVCAVALMVPLIATQAGAEGIARAGAAAAARGNAAASTPSATPVATGGPRAGGGAGFRGGGFRGGFRGDRFRGGVFIGAPFGYYDPFWWPYDYGYGYGPYGYYPPPSVVREYRSPSPDYLIPPDGPAPEQSWYHCSNPEGYYPYVRSCDGPWQAVPVTPDRGPPPPDRGPPPRDR